MQVALFNNPFFPPGRARHWRVRRLRGAWAACRPHGHRHQRPTFRQQISVQTVQCTMHTVQYGFIAICAGAWGVQKNKNPQFDCANWLLMV